MCLYRDNFNFLCPKFKGNPMNRGLSGSNKVWNGISMKMISEENLKKSIKRIKLTLKILVLAHFAK
jgi:hypothetical protein